MLDAVKKSLRISNDYFNDEIEDLIESARLDLVQSGISFDKAKSDTDPLIRRAIITYCKANFGLADKDTVSVKEMYQKSYEMIKQHLSLSGDYGV